MTRITPVILSGGSGEPLWPLSTEAKPKQFLSLASPHTMLADALARTCIDERFDPVLIIGEERHRTLIEAELGEPEFSEARIILEPLARSTAPAIALAAIAAGGGDTVMLVMPSDHVILDFPAFLAAVDAALPAALAGWLVTFGITPTGPETGFGYIRMGDPVDGAPGVWQVNRFIEKPPRDKAEAMLTEGGYAWNAGMFLMRADRYLAELTRQAPEMERAARASLKGVHLSARHIRPHANVFAACPPDSIDFAVMERSQQVAIIPVECGWYDVGSWDALANIGKPDSDGNTLSGQVVLIDSRDSRNSHIHADGIVVTATGIKDLIIVAKDNHLMILPKGRSQDVKKILTALQTRD